MGAAQDPWKGRLQIPEGRLKIPEGAAQDPWRASPSCRMGATSNHTSGSSSIEARPCFYPPATHCPSQCPRAQHWPKLSTAGRFNATVVNVALETHILGHVHAFRQRATSEGRGPSGALQPLGLACTWPLVRRHSKRSPRAMGAGSQQGAQPP